MGKLENDYTSPVKRKMITKQIRTHVGTRRGRVARGRRGMGQVGLIPIVE